jgi:hypothetical protein
MDGNQSTTHHYSVEKNRHHVPEPYWLNKHFWFDDYERVERNPGLFDTEQYTIVGIQFSLEESPDESPGNPDGRCIWLTVRHTYELDLPSDNAHNTSSIAECSIHDGYLTKTETLLDHLGYEYDTHEVRAVRLDKNNDGLYVTVCERVSHPVKADPSDEE